MDLTFQIPMQYCSLQCQTFLPPSDSATTEHHFHFGPAASFFPGTISNFPPLPSSMLDTFWSEGLIFWCHIFLPFHTIHGVLEARILEWVVISPTSGPHFIRTLHYDHPSRMAQHGMAHSFIELHKPFCYNKAVIHAGDPSPLFSLYTYAELGADSC